MVHLGLYGPEAWEPLLDQDVEVPPEIPGDTLEERRSRYARFLAGQLRLSYPTAVVGAMVAAGEMPLPGGREVGKEMASFLLAHQGEFELGLQPVERYLRSRGLRIQQPTVSAVKIKTLQRVYQISPSTGGGRPGQPRRHHREDGRLPASGGRVDAAEQPGRAGIDAAGKADAYVPDPGANRAPRVRKPAAADRAYPRGGRVPEEQVHQRRTLRVAAGELSRLYYEHYKFAFDAARQAEQAMKHELMRPELDQLNFIKFNYWDGGRKGLLAGVALQLDIKRMEMACYPVVLLALKDQEGRHARRVTVAAGLYVLEMTSGSKA